MPIIKSAKKALRGSEKKRVFNIRRKRNIKDVIRSIEKFVLGGEVDKAEELLPTAYKALDKAAKENTIKKNNASRKKSRLSAFIKRAKEAK
jgi:small subunit ribosomal protein S20